MNKVMLYCEMNDLTGFGHYNRMKILLKIMNLRNVDIITDNLKIAKVFFTNQNVLKVYLQPSPFLYLVSFKSIFRF